MNKQLFKQEIETDPLDRGYASMSSVEVADDLNTAYREKNIQIMTASQILNATEKSEYDGLNTGEKDAYWNLLHMGELNPWGVEASIMVDLFGSGSQTIQTLGVQRKVPCSRAEELGLGTIRWRDVAKIRGEV